MQPTKRTSKSIASIKYVPHATLTTLSHRQIFPSEEDKDVGSTLYDSMVYHRAKHRRPNGFKNEIIICIYITLIITRN